ncbi:MAG TPA: class III extradiol dioxygenase subunit beta [Candidatus Acidoferrum sp.]|nr:class III extradiol dioxygenase subunit beta [Candidatus Acidoferrum sp.]
MAKITAGIGCSHVPAIGAAFDQGLTQEPYWKPLFDGYEPAREWLKKHKPDVAILVYNDHGSALTLDLIPTFGIGVADEFIPADEGWGPRNVPIVKGHQKLAWHLAETLIINEFDMCVMNKLDVDHGLTVPLNIMCGKVDEWPMAIIPIPVNVVMFPVPTGDRCWRMGEVIRKAVEAFPEDLNVVIFGTGGMSHQIHGERSGMINRDFDTKFLNDLTKNPSRLRKIKHEDYVTNAGAEGIEMVMWMVMRAALGDNNVHEAYRHYHVPASNTAAGLIILENDDLKGPKKKAAPKKKAVKKAAKKPAAKKPAVKKAEKKATKKAAKKVVKKVTKKAPAKKKAKKK